MQYTCKIAQKVVFLPAKMILEYEDNHSEPTKGAR